MVEHIQGVWHLKENPSDAPPQMKDSTANANNGTSVGTMTGGDQVSGKIDGCLHFDGTDDYINCGTGASTSGKVGTMAAWIKAAASQKVNARIVEKGIPSDRVGFYMVTNLWWYAVRTGVAGVSFSLQSGPLNDSTWHYVAGTWGTAGAVLYVDGAAVTNVAGDMTITNMPANPTNFIGKYVGTTSSGYEFNGLMDEIRNSDVVFSSNWVWACYATVASNSLFATNFPVQGGQTPQVTSLLATNVTPTTACLNGFLSSTGASDTAVMVYWGPTDGGASLNAWANTNTWAAPQSAGFFSTNVPLTPGTECFYRFAASNSAGVVPASSSQYLITTNVAITVTPTVIGEANVVGTFQFDRPAALTSGVLTVNFTLGGTASNGADYSLVSATSVTIPAGATSATLPVTTLADGILEGNESVALTEADGPCVLNASATTTLTLVDTPTLSTLAASSVSPTSASLNGSLSGATNTTVFVYWGPTDGSTGTWSNVYVFPTPQNEGALSTTVALPGSDKYYYRYAASNSTAGFVWASLPVQYFYAWPVGTVYGDRFVTTNGTGDGSIWATAANIYAGVTAVPTGRTVWVASGVYMLTNQLGVTNFSIKSYNNGARDRDGTIIDGGYPNNTNRCFTLSHANALVDGFTITNGYLTGANYGAGVYISHGTLANCLVTGNTITNNVDGLGGAGIYAINADSVITNCDIIANNALNKQQGGGVYLDTSAQLWNSRILYNRGGNAGSGAGGGGVRMAAGALLYNSVIASNTSSYQGGGVNVIGAGAIMRNCLVKGNLSSWDTGNGGVVAYSGIPKVENCTIVNNAVKIPYSGGFGGLMAVFINVVHDSAVVFGYVSTNGAFTNCCFTTTNGFVNSSGNIATNNPRFVSAATGNYRLRPDSPCRNAGTNQTWMVGAVDLDGNPRISPVINGTVDMGAYEYVVNSGSIFTVR